MRNGVADAIVVALIALLSTVITVVVDKESDGAVTSFIYYDANNIVDCNNTKK